VPGNSGEDPAPLPDVQGRGSGVQIPR